MKGKILFLLTFCLIFNTHLFGNERNIDVYLPDSISNQSLNIKIGFILDSAEKLMSTDHSKTRQLVSLAKYYADSINNRQGSCKALFLLGKLDYANGDFYEAEEVFQHLLDNFSDVLNEKEMADIKHALGLTYMRFNNYNKAINLIQEALFFYEEHNNRLDIATATKDMGIIYYNLGNNNSALEQYQKALVIYRELQNDDGIARCYNNIGMIFREKGNFPMALEYLNQSLEIKYNQKNSSGIANTLGNIGHVYFSANEIDKAINHYNKSLEKWLELDNANGISEVYNYLGEVYLKTGEYQKAIDVLLKGNKIATKNKLKQRLIDNYRLLSNVYTEKAEYNNALQYFKQYSIIRDSLYESLTNQRISEYISRYERLRAENELIDHERQILKQRFQIIITLIILLTSIILLFILYRQNRTIRRKSKKIQKINKELDYRVQQKTSELRIARFSIELAFDAIIWMQKNGKIFYVNQSACNMLAYKKEELEKMSIFDIVPEFTQDIWNEYWEQLKKKKSFVIQLYYQTKMGTEIPVDAAFNFRMFEGEEYNFAFSRNITERKISEEKLKKAKERAEKSDRLKSAFLANMSHEIRTPMNAINGFLSLLADPDITGKQRSEITELAQSSSHDLLNIINDIIDISKIEADELMIDRSLNFVNMLMHEIYHYYRKDLNYLHKNKVELKLEIENDRQSDKIAIYTDKARFKQIMSNLISNAIKFTDEGEIVFGYKKISSGGRNLLKFFVKDTGIGIPKESQKYIFDRFSKLDDERKKSYKGTGLGLAISKKLVNMLGGEIGVDSDIDRGSEFYFTLPYKLLDSKENHLIQTQERKLEIDWKNKFILIVEDTPSNYFLLENYLKPTKVHTFWAKSGKEAIEIFKETDHIDLVLMDIQLPGINGYEVTKLIKAHNKNIPIIAQTAYALSGEKEHSIKEGCDDYIAKPIKKENLID
ncbi:MAG: tetratricopeptide repeat protein, partial [Bacteroidales bacterium]